MAYYLFYPSVSATLDNLATLLCPPSADYQRFVDRLLGANQASLFPTEHCTPKTPILVPEQACGDNRSTALMSLSPQQHAVLAALSRAVGGGVVMGLADFFSRQNFYQAKNCLRLYGGKGLASVGADSGIAVTAVLLTLDKYERALWHYDGLRAHGASPQMLAAAMRRLQRAFDRHNLVVNLQSQASFNQFAASLRNSPLAGAKAADFCIPLQDHNAEQKLAMLAKSITLISDNVLLFSNHTEAVGAASAWHDQQAQMKRRLIDSGSRLAAGMSLATFVAITPLGLAINLVPTGSLAIRLRQAQGWFDLEYS
ncbi:hypothetical protein [Halioxenophilus sp. WMMB6]|uniref:hypothetical protein n=1 Tax=Halioxenophilus sp. WMMB6 TaxID=3073815 RepID=UPI00295E665B|nr:hypothetical protein [Halioxenophilus sp. WMMB6]